MDPTATTGQSSETWHLRLYIAGQTPRSLRAVDNLKALCETYLPGRHEIEIVDLAEMPSRAKADEIVVIPTLVRRHASASRKIIGDLSNTRRVLLALQLQWEISQ